MKKNLPTIILVIVAIGIVAAIAYLESTKSSKGSFVLGGANVNINLDRDSLQEKNSKYEVAKEIAFPDDFINTNGEEIKIADLIGEKVILIDFWTYSCINCQRTLPYLTAWYEKYKDQGLEIIGMHTPEFEFEKDVVNVQKAVDKWGIEYPVVLDNDYGTWRNYKNRYWPRKYLIDIDGFIVYDHIGEGSYDETEKEIQKALAERMQVLDEKGRVSSGIVDPENVEKVDLYSKRSPETYFGALRNINFGNGAEGKVGVQDLDVPSAPSMDVLYLDGEWDIQGEYAKNLKPGSKIVFKYQAQKVFLVASADEDVALTILIDGQPAQNAGSDVVEGVVTVNEDKLYRLIEDEAGNNEHTLEIIVNDVGLKAFAFTFG